MCRMNAGVTLAAKDANDAKMWFGYVERIWIGDAANTTTAARTLRHSRLKPVLSKAEGPLLQKTLRE